MQFNVSSSSMTQILLTTWRTLNSFQWALNRACMPQKNFLLYLLLY